MTETGRPGLAGQAAEDRPAAHARVTFVVSALVVGGAERVLTALANGWAGRGSAVTIISLDSDELPPFFTIDPGVTTVRLDLQTDSANAAAAIMNNLRRLIRLRRAIRRTRPDVVISFMDRTNVLVLLATIDGRWPVIVADRTAGDPASGRSWRFLRRITYRRASAIVVQTEASGRVIDPWLRRRTIAIPNPVLEPEPPLAAGPVGGEEPHLVVALGRLVDQKGFDLLIEAFATVVRRVPDARLEIWGDGPEREALAAAIEARGLAEHVTLAGATRQPQAALARSEVFVLSSRIEGFPNVLIEAMALGRPVVAFDCTFGPAEIVRHGVDGLLVPVGDVDGLAAAVVRLLSEPETRTAMGQRAVEVRGRFAPGAILDRWMRLAQATSRR